MGKKNLFWFLLGGIGIVQVILYFVFIAPQGSELETLVEELQKKTDKLKHQYLEKEIPTAEVIAKHGEYKRLLEEEHKKVVQFYREKDDNLEKRFVGSPGSPPPLDWFKAKYTDEFNALRRKCEEAGVRIIAPTDVSEEEKKIVTEWPKPAASDASETLSKGGGFGFWEGEPITTMNQKAAQKQYWVQETIAEALQSAGVKALVAVSFAKSPKPAGGRAGKPKEEKEPQTEFERLFDVIEVRFLVQVDYKNVGRIMSAVNASPINFVFRSMRVIKPTLKEIVIEKKPPVQKQIRLITGKDFWGTFPRVFPSPVDLGSCEAANLNKLPTQFDLLPEPPALVEFHYWALDLKGE
jgi:hypothetical protein